MATFIIEVNRMKIKTGLGLSVLAILLSMTVSCQQQQKKEEKKLDLKDADNQAAYIIGLKMGQTTKSNLKSMGEIKLDIPVDIVNKGFADAMAGNSQLTDKEVADGVKAFEARIRSKLAEKQKIEAAANLEKSKAYLAENAKKEGVVTTKSGLQYKILRPGTGPSPSAKDNVKVHYKGTLIDGKKFDSSYDRKQPATFPVGGVIPGWTEALLKMKKGAKWQLTIPSDLAYGEKGRPGIPANSVLLFDVELLDINPAVEKPKKQEDPKPEHPVK